MFVVAAWIGKDGKKLHFVTRHYPLMVGDPKLFVTKEEAEEHCNTELFGWDYAIINLEFD